MTLFKKIVFSGLLTSAVAATSLTAMAWPGDGPRNGGGKPGMGHSMDGGEHTMMMGMISGRMAEKLGLSDEQKTEIKGIVDKARDKGQPLRLAMFDAMQAERVAIHDRADEKTLKQLAHASADARVAMLLHGFAVEHDIESVLTDDQRKQLEEIKAERFSRMQERMEKQRERMDD